MFLFVVSATPGLQAQSTNWVSGTSVFNITYGTAADSDVVDNATLIVTNGGKLTAGQLNVGPTNRSTLTLLTNAAITVQTLLATNVVCGGVANSTLNFSNAYFSTLTTSNYNGLASSILLGSNVNWSINANWNMNAGTNIIANVATNGNAAASIFFANTNNGLQFNVNSNAVLWMAIPAGSFATNTSQLVIGNGNATNNVFTVNGGTLIVTNNKGSTTAMIVGNSAGSTGNQLIITNGGQALSDCRQDAGAIAGLIGNAGNNNSLIVAGTNSAGLKSTWNLFSDRLQINNSAAYTNNWIRVDQGGVITNATIMMFYSYGYMFITNGGQFFTPNATVGRSGYNSSLIVGNADAAGNKATLTFTSGSMTVGGGSVSANNPGTNCLVRVDQGGLITNVTSIYIGGNANVNDSNCVANSFIITNGGQVFSTGTNVIGILNGCHTNYATVGGGTGNSLWNLGNRSLTIGNNAMATNNSTTLFGGGVITNVSSVILGGANSLLNFNGGTLAAGGNGNLIATNANTLNATNYVQTGGAVIDSVTYNVTNVLSMLQDPTSPGGGLTKLGGGTLTLLGTNTYTGQTTISAGTLMVNNNATINTGLLTLNGGTLSNSASCTLTNAVNLNAASTVGVASGQTLTFSGMVTNTSSLTLAGSGTLLLNGNFAAATGTLTVNSGATYGDTGTNGGNVVLNAGANLAPGGLNNVGTLTLTNHLYLNGNSLFVDLGNTAGSCDVVAVTNVLYLTNANTVALSCPNGTAPAGTYTLMTFANGYVGTGTFALGGSLTNNASLQLNANTLVLTVGVGGIYADTWKGYVNGTWDTSVLNWTNGNPVVHFFNNDAVIFDDTLVGSSTITNATPGATVTPGSVTLNNSLTNYTINANIVGPGSLTKSGSATTTLTGTNTYSGNTTINAGNLIVNNGGTINSPAATLNIVSGTNTLTGSGAITVATLLSTNVVTAGSANSIFNFTGGTLTTSNATTAIAANILLTSNTTFNVSGNWNMLGGTNYVTSVQTNGVFNNVSLGKNASNTVVTVSNAVLSLANPTAYAYYPTNLMSLYVGNGAGSNNVLNIINGGQVYCGSYSGSGLIGLGVGSTTSNANDGVIVAGTNGGGSKSRLDCGGGRLYIGQGGSFATNNWCRVDGGVVTNIGGASGAVYTIGVGASLIITNGGQILCNAGAGNVGRTGLTNYWLVAGADNAGNPATYNGGGGSLLIGGITGVSDSVYSGTNNWLWVGQGGLITNVGVIYVGADTNALKNSMVITNGGQVFSAGASAIGSVPGCNSNAVTIGGGTNSSLWDLGSSTLTIGNNAAATNNSATLFSGGVVTNLDTLILGGANSRLNFNGGMLVADGNGNLIVTNSTTVNATNYVQAGGAIINDNGFTVTSQLPLLQDPNSAGGGLTKLGSGSLTLPGVNTYTGPTFVVAGTLALSGSASIATSPNITLAGGAGLDVSGLSNGFTLGGSQTLSNSATGANLNGNLDCSSGVVSLLYDGTNASFSIASGTLTLSANTVFKLNITGSTLARGGYNIVYGGAGQVAGTVPNTVTYTGASMSGTPSLQIVNGGLYLDVGGTMSGITYGPTAFAYNGSAQGPTITFTGSTGAKTTNYEGTGLTSYASVNAPTNIGTYYVSNTVAGDTNYFGTANSTVFIINPVANVSFSPTNTGLVLNPTFCGLSYEKSFLTKNLFVSTDTSLISMFSQIAPAVLRIGGDSVDTTCWGGLSNQIPITAAQVDALAGFVKALPTNWHVIYGINMSSNSPANCAAEAAYVANALGSSLLGFEIGNEPDIYRSNGTRPGSYTYAQFLSQWQVLAAAITNSVPGWAITNGGNGWTLTGPASANNTSGYTMPFATNEAGVISLLTHHYYRGDSQSTNSTMALLLSPDPTLPGTASNITAAATANHLPLGFRMAECGSFFNGGNAVSASYGAALWTLDYMFTLALNGCQGINFHGGGSGNTYTPIADNGTAVIQARPEFYGLKLFSLASIGGSVVPATNTVATNFNFTAYGVRQGPGVMGAILNNKETNYSIQVTINLGSNVVAVSNMMLTGSALSSTNGYTLGGAAINPDGSWTGGIQSVTLATNGQVIVTVPPITALWLNPVTEGTNTLLANDAAGTSSFTGATNWTDGMAPHIFASYFTLTNLLRTPATGSGLTFAGDSLTIGPSSPGNSSFRFAFNAPGGACTVNNGVLAGGIIDDGVVNATNYLSGTNWLVTAPSGFGLGGDNTRAIVLTNLNLSGTFALSNGAAGGGLGTMIYAGNAANFTGPLVTSAGTTLQAYSQTNLGGNPASFNTAQFVLDNGNFQPLASMSMTNANSGVTINSGGGTFNVGSSLTLTIGNPIAGTGSLTNLGGGQLILSGTNTYSGVTAINAGTLALSDSASISNSSSFTVAGGAVFNVSGLSNAFTLGGSQTLSNSAVGAILKGTNNCNSGTISLLYDGSHPSFIMTNGGMKLSASTVVNVNNTSSALGAGSYVIITNAAAGTAGLVAGTPPSTVNLRGNTFANTTAGLQINNNRLYLVIKTNQSITFASGTSLTKTYGNAPFADIATASSGLTVTYSSDNPAVATVDSSGNVTIVGVGSCHILADQSGNGTYNAAPEASQLLTINPGTSSVSYGSTTFTYNGTAHSPTISVSSLSTGNKTTNYVGAGATSYSSVSAPTNAGSYALTNTVLLDANNYGTTNGVAFTIGQVTPTMNLFSSAQTNGYRASVFFTATNLPGDVLSNVVFKANGVSFSTNAVANGGTTSLSITNLPRGTTNIIMAIYNGDNNHLPYSTNLIQTVTNHPPAVTRIYVSRTAGSAVNLRWSDVATNWSDADGDVMTKTGINLTTTNSATLATNNSVILYPNNAPNVNDEFRYTITDGFGGTNTGYVEIVVNLFTAGQAVTGQQTTNIIGGSTFTVIYHGIPTYTYELQRSTNLSLGEAGWVNISTNTVGSGAAVTNTDSFIDLGGIIPSEAYYRVGWHP